MANIDIIGIGAINLDLIFSSKKSDIRDKKASFDNGEESFVKKHVFDERELNTKSYSEFLQAQVGGSALLAVRTVKSMCSQLTTAYVGVYGNIPSSIKKTDLPQTPEELKETLDSFIDDDSWLFFDEKQDTGCALVKMHKNQRQFINILPGANNSLYSNITEKGVESFIAFLASAKWIHMTSLKDVFQFKQIANCVKEAKAKNPSLTVSIDPGYDYTKNHWKTLKEILPIADFVFLSSSELANISLNQGLSMRVKALDLGTELINIKANPQIIIVKNPSKTILLSLIDNTPYKRTYYHKKLAYTKVLNDTGAGDAFAGGFIVGKLSPMILSHQPAPIELAAIAARERLKSIGWPTELKKRTFEYFSSNMRNEKINEKQFLKIRLDFLKHPIIDFMLGLIVGIISNIIYNKYFL